MPHVFVLAALLAAANPVFLRPVDQTVLPPGPLSVVAQTDAELKLDGKPVAATHPAPGVLTATIEPAAGMHELAAGDAKVRFFVGTSGAPAGWKAFRVHPPQASCDTCHAVVKGAWDFKGGEVAANCFQCHDQKAFPKIHQHNVDTLIDCQVCHSPHGSTEKAHLKMPKAVACKQCHG